MKKQISNVAERINNAVIKGARRVRKRLAQKGKDGHTFLFWYLASSVSLNFSSVLNNTQQMTYKRVQFFFFSFILSLNTLNSSPQ